MSFVEKVLKFENGELTLDELKMLKDKLSVVVRKMYTMFSVAELINKLVNRKRTFSQFDFCRAHHGFLLIDVMKRFVTNRSFICAKIC